MIKKPSHPSTTLVTAGRESRLNHGIVNPPVYHASTILHPTVESLEKKTLPYSYGRRGTPTTTALQDAIAEIEGGYRTLLAPSGLSAVTTALLAHLDHGDHLLMVDTVYGPTRSFCEGILRRFGIEVDYYDPLIGAGISKLFKSNTKVVFTESPGSLTFEVQDIPAIAAAAHARNIIVMLDNTWATPLFFRAFDHGVDICIEAATKYFCGHSDVMMGSITCTQATYDKTLAGHGTLGVSVAPDDVYLLLRGMRTMGVRLKQHMETGLQLANWLKAQPEVARVLHPALESDPGHALWKRDFTGASGLFSILLKPCAHDAMAAMLDHLEYFGMGYSWGGFESLIVPQYPRSVRSATKWQEDGYLLRIHAGLEDASDLIADLDAGLARLRAYG
ncbi:MAG: cystathionine beta-lyase [Parvibaculaceae bacterium]|nr:cystathionine beta-lyase [Parvibaculaceae bacterium]